MLKTSASGRKVGGQYSTPITPDKGSIFHAGSHKGNISREGKRIYHLPAGRYYAPTRIDESKGERWFCTEEEAYEAGWRKLHR